MCVSISLTNIFESILRCCLIFSFHENALSFGGGQIFALNHIFDIYFLFKVDIESELKCISFGGQILDFSSIYGRPRFGNLQRNWSHFFPFKKGGVQRYVLDRVTRRKCDLMHRKMSCFYTHENSPLCKASVMRMEINVFVALAGAVTTDKCHRLSDPLEVTLTLTLVFEMLWKP